MNMKAIMLLFSLFTFGLHLSWSQLQLETQKLPKKIDETSGLEFYEDHFITHNDSGGSPKLYVFDAQGQMLLEAKINQAVNRDWEDIAADQCHLFIADVGNNSGSRKDLTIYILNTHLMLEDSIKINYKAQTQFNKRKRHPFDAESLTVVGDSLLLFSKDREQFQTQLYVFPKVGGQYTLVPVGQLPAESLITAADYNATLKLLALTGYNPQGEQFFYLMPEFSYKNLKKENFKKYILPLEEAQVEAVKIIDRYHFWLTSEDEGNGHPRLFKLTLN